MGIAGTPNCIAHPGFSPALAWARFPGPSSSVILTTADRSGRAVPPTLALPASCPDLHFAGSTIRPRVIRSCGDTDGLGFRRLVRVKTFAFDRALANNMTPHREHSIQQRV